MTDLILHHYPTSPFSEKVRLVLGMKRVAWRSVVVPAIMPKPDVVALTGGYRRTPFMQIGADIYCDSALMCRVIDRLWPEPPLYPAASAGSRRSSRSGPTRRSSGAPCRTRCSLPARAHLCGAAARGGEGLRRRSRRDESVDAARADGRRGRRARRLPRPARRDARRRPHLSARRAASIADFSATQSIWFLRRAPPVATILDAYPRVVAWHERVAAFGQGTSTRLGSDEAIAIAAAATAHAPTSIAAGQPFAAGDLVRVAAADYAHDEIVGAVVGLDGDEVVLERTDARAGTVHVHFPRVGFHIKPANKDSA